MFKNFLAFFFQANVTKRISIVTVSIILIGNQVTASNVCGMLMAILGVFYYNKVKYEENKARSTLPTTMTPSSGGVEKKGGSILWQNQRGVAEDAQHVKLITSRAPSQHVRIIISFLFLLNYSSTQPPSSNISEVEDTPHIVGSFMYGIWWVKKWYL